MPASLTYPGVYIEELPSNVHSIAGVATSIAAFIGWAPQGPTDKAVLVQSFPQFQSIFGGFVSGSPPAYLAYAVNHFFANGGSEAYIIRLVWDGSLPAAPGTNPAVATTAVAAGIGFASAKIAAKVGSVVSPSVTVDIGPAVLQSLVIAPANLPGIPLGAEVTLTASGVFADGTTGALGGPVAWSSSNPSIPILPTGVVTANSAGSTVITAKSGLLSASTTLTVGGASAVSLVLNPASVPLNAGQTQQLSVIATLSDGTTQDVTPLVSWTSDRAAGTDDLKRWNREAKPRRNRFANDHSEPRDCRPCAHEQRHRQSGRSGPGQPHGLSRQRRGQRWADL